MVAVQRLTADPRQHSQYQGWPVFTGWLAKDDLLARLGEAVFVWVAGICLMRVRNRPGGFTLGQPGTGDQAWNRGGVPRQGRRGV